MSYKKISDGLIYDIWQLYAIGLNNYIPHCVTSYIVTTDGLIYDNWQPYSIGLNSYIPHCITSYTVTTDEMVYDIWQLYAINLNSYIPHCITSYIVITIFSLFLFGFWSPPKIGLNIIILYIFFLFLSHVSRLESYSLHVSTIWFWDTVLSFTRVA